jgi:hypothetical protein
MPQYGVYVTHNTELSTEQEQWVCLLAGPPGSALCGLTAAALDGFEGFDTSDTHLVIPEGNRRPQRPGLVDAAASACTTARHAQSSWPVGVTTSTPTGPSTASEAKCTARSIWPLRTWDADLDRHNDLTAGGRRILQFSSYTARHRKDYVGAIVSRALRQAGWR